MKATRSSRTTWSRTLALAAAVLVIPFALAGGPGEYDKEIYPITDMMHVDLTVEQENYYEIYMAISGHCHADDSYCADRQAWDEASGTPVMGGGRILFKATDASGVPAAFVSASDVMKLYFGYRGAPPADDHRIPRPVAIHGETAGEHMTTFENGPTLSFLNEGPSLISSPAVEVRGMRFLRQFGVGFETGTSGGETRLDLYMHDCVVQDVRYGPNPSMMDAMFLNLRASGSVVLRGNRVIRTNPHPARPDTGVWMVARSGPIHANIIGNHIDVTDATEHPLNSIGILMGAFMWDPGYPAKNTFHFARNICKGVVVWTPNGSVSVTENKLTAYRDAMWLATQEETELVVTGNEIEMLPGANIAIQVAQAGFALPFHSGTITGNTIHGEARYGVYVENGAHDARFLWNDMRGLETEHELYYFNWTTHDNFVMGYTDNCNVHDEGIDNCIVGCGCSYGND